MLYNLYNISYKHYQVSNSRIREVSIYINIIYYNRPFSLCIINSHKQSVYFNCFSKCLQRHHTSSTSSASSRSTSRKLALEITIEYNKVQKIIKLPIRILANPGRDCKGKNFMEFFF